MPIPPLHPRSQRTLLKPIHKGVPEKKITGKRSFKQIFWRILFPIGIMFLLLLGIGLIGAFAYYSRDLPDPEKINERSVAESTQIFARDEKTLLYEIHGDVRRTVIKIDEIPRYAVDATIAIEDKDFYKHKGVSVTGIIRALFSNVRKGSVSGQGGSTITQQFIKNAVLTTEKSWSRKIKEAVLAYQMESKFTKEQILQLYFNEIPYGSNVYGIQSAARYYFNKDGKDLTLDEAALLAALPQAPTYYSPHGTHTDILVGRQQYILDQMVGQNLISKDEAEAAKKVDVMAKVSPPKESIIAPHFVFYVRQYLIDKYGEALVERGGLKVITTLEPTLQQYAESAVAEYGPVNKDRYGASNAALVSLNPITGQVLAMVGSRDYFDKENDGNVNVVIRERNPGSSFKPYVYAAAFTKGYTPKTILFDLKTNFGPQGDGTSYVPNNYDGGERGPIEMRKALAGSLNIPAVKTLYLVGIPTVVDLAKKAGYTTIKNPEDYGLALALGGAGVRLLDHTSAFGVFAQNGMHRAPKVVLKVLDHKGKMLEQFKVDETRVLDENIAHMMANLLSDNDARSYIFGSGSKLFIPGRQVGAKTGTTNDWRDGWTVGFTPSLVAGVWVGNNDYSTMARGADGSFVAAPIWNAFMKNALAGAPNERFPSYKEPRTDKPVLTGNIEGESLIYVDSVTKLAIPNSCLATYPEAFKEKSTYREVHDILYFVNKDDPQGDPPDNPEGDPQFARWEEPVRAWAQKQGYTGEKPKEGDCDIRSEESQPTIAFTSPTAGATITSRSPKVTVDVETAYDITTIVFTIDDVVIGTAKNGATTATLDLGDYTNGFQSLKATVTDEYKNTANVSLDVNLLFSD